MKWDLAVERDDEDRNCVYVFLRTKKGRDYIARALPDSKPCELDNGTAGILLCEDCAPRFLARAVCAGVSVRCDRDMHREIQAFMGTKQ
jgi:hypothetical protein